MQDPDHIAVESFLDLTPEYLEQRYSTWTALDRLWACYTLGGHARSLYRYGHRSDCQEYVDLFKFSMSLKTCGAEERRRRIEERERQRAMQRASQPNSLRVWQVRPQLPSVILPSHVADKTSNIV